MKHWMWRKKDVTTVQCESAYVLPHIEAGHIERKELEWLVKSLCMLPLCHPFTAVVAGPTGCGNCAWVLRLTDNVREKIEPAPSRIWYYYGEHQPAFDNYPEIHFEKVYHNCDEVFDGRQSTTIVIEDYMSYVNQLVADIFTKTSHRNISTVYVTQNLFHKNKYAGTISLNSHHLVMFRNCWDTGQFAIFAKQMYPPCWKFAVEGYEDATSVPYGYLLVDLKPDQDEQCRLRTGFFLESCSNVCLQIKLVIWEVNTGSPFTSTMMVIMENALGVCPLDNSKITWTNIVSNGVITAKSCRVLRVDYADVVVLAFVLPELEVLVWLILYAILIETLDWMMSLFMNLYVVSCSIVSWRKWNKWLKLNNSCFSFTHTCTHTWNAFNAPSMSTDCVTDGYADGIRAQYVINVKKLSSLTNSVGLRAQKSQMENSKNHFGFEFLWHLYLTWGALMTTRKIWCFTYSANLSHSVRFSIW